jgi:hypothetical protein
MVGVFNPIAFCESGVAHLVSEAYAHALNKNQPGDGPGWF